MLLVVCLGLLIRLMKRLIVGVVGRQTYNTLLLCMILVSTYAGAYQEATEVPLLVGASRTDPRKLLWLWGTRSVWIVIDYGLCGFFEQATPVTLTKEPVTTDSVEL